MASYEELSQYQFLTKSHLASHGVARGRKDYAKTDRVEKSLSISQLTRIFLQNTRDESILTCVEHHERIGPQNH